MREHHDRERLRQTFGSVAEQYDRARPTYPAAVFDHLAELAGLEPGSRVLEIGPGTGKATAELVRRGYAVTGIELSQDLAAIARRNVPSAEIEVGEFEGWEPREADFDAIVAFAAFHWIAPELRYAKSAQLLRPGGSLAAVHGSHVLPEDGDPFFVEVQEDYDAVVPHPTNRPPPPPECAESWTEQFLASGVFARVEDRRVLQPLRYSADGFIALLGTFSDNLALPVEQREELFRRVHARITTRPSGVVTKHYLQTLTLGSRPYAGGSHRYVSVTASSTTRRLAARQKEDERDSPSRLRDRFVMVAATGRSGCQRPRYALRRSSCSRSSAAGPSSTSRPVEST